MQPLEIIIHVEVIYVISLKDELHIIVIQQLLEGTITRDEAARICKLSSRQIQRLYKKAKDQGILSIRHGNIGRETKHAIPKETVAYIIHLYRTKYSDVSFSKFATIIIQQEQLRISASTIYRILHQAGFQPKNKPRVRRLTQEDKGDTHEDVQGEGDHTANSQA